MTRSLRNAALLLVVLLASAPVFGQGRAVWHSSADIVEGVYGVLIGTAVDVNEARSSVTIQTDDDRYGQIDVVTDAVSTQYNGFGDVINGKPEIFTGSKGFSNVREGDRLEIRGTGRGNGVMSADRVTLLGRTIPAPQTGVGDTRSPSRGISTPSVGSAATVYSRIEGVIRQINPAESRIVVETDRREMLNLRAAGNTPVTYKGDAYQISNLEIGDRVRIESDGGRATDREVRARSIEVLQSVQEGSGARVSGVSGRVTRIDRTADVARVDTGRGEVRVDMSRAVDSTGRRVRAADLQVGDVVDLSGNYASNSTTFNATTVRFNTEDVFSTDPNAAQPQGYTADLVTVSLSGIVTETLQSSPTLAIRDKASNRLIALYVAEDFSVKTKTGTYTTADKLSVNDNVLVKAYRDADGNYIAQTIRMR